MEKSTRKNIISTIITIIILLLGLMIFKKFTGMKTSTVSTSFSGKERRTVEVAKFQPGNHPNIIEIDGRINAHERVNITSKVSGVMQQGSRSVKQGKFFKKGALLFSIDDREARFDLKARKSNLMTAITQMMPDLKFDYPEVYSDWLDYLNHFNPENPLSPFPEPRSDQEKYFISGRGIYNQYYQIKALEVRLSEYRIYAPFSGVVTEVNVFPGALINPGSSLATMINTGLYEMSAPVPLYQLNFLKTGQKVTLHSEDLNRKWTGKISRIGTEIDATTQYIPLFISVTGDGLKDGMYLQGEIVGSDYSDVFKLPKTIFTSPTGIYIIEDSTIVEKTIQPVSREKNHVLISGLDTSDLVVTGSLAGLFEGQKVNY